jgi:hypothetical protein
MQRRCWMGVTGAAASLAFGLLVGCTNREEPAATSPPGAPPGGPAATGQARDTTPAAATKVVKLNVKGMT